jgi:hypothetical protein
MSKKVIYECDICSNAIDDAGSQVVIDRGDYFLTYENVCEFCDGEITAMINEIQKRNKGEIYERHDVNKHNFR